MKVSKPIFIIGTGRCGSTAFHQLLALHPHVMWLSGFAERYPDKPEWNRWAVSAVGNRVIRKALGGKIKPGENYGFWYKHAFGFAEPGRDLVAADVTARVKKQMHRALQPMLSKRRNRLLIKLTGWSRIGFLNEIFPDAKFIHIVRDGRAVASSLLHVNAWQWRGWYGPSSWRYGPLPADDQAAWERHNRSFVALAGLQWKIHSRAVEAARKELEPARFLEVKYETLCREPVATIRQAAEFAELPWPQSFEKDIKGASIRDMSARWRDDLTLQQQNLLTTLLRDDLLRYGYETS